ncbi:MAG: N-acetyl sugar amidotransferase [Candidatus Omnitrophica bacterium]|nr:N-acetyl sugar amidotransferase [Candidatus Omnitrophota bacterium]MDD5352070.1 N-acetyl sugar amidotransferase [Candidatus Omnitrophota bacterium]MDD5549668.1 N-acetyl sugar amidotransferase [Candidatus Omnitrophota bacterium]
MELERCVRCTLPITWETLYFDDKGVCNICKNWDAKQKVINWKTREKQLLRIFEDAKKTKRAYDCIVPFSGGKDSTFTLWAIIKRYKIKPLVVSFDHGFYRPKTIENRTRTFRKLGVDVITFTPNWHIVKKLMLESLIRKGDFCWHCHAGIFAYPMQIAVKFKIPLIIWGEGGGEYEGYFKFEDIEETDEWKFNRRIILGMRAEDMAGFIGAELKDLQPYLFPSKEELDEIGVKSLPLGKFIQWDQQKQVEIIKSELGWQEDEVESNLPGPSFDKVECMFAGIRDYIKYLKRGFSRITHRTTIDIRNGKMSREAAMELIRKYEARKPKSLTVFLEYLGICEEEFNDIVSKHLIPPAKPVDPKTLIEGPKLHDQDLWFRENKI